MQTYSPSAGDIANATQQKSFASASIIEVELSHPLPDISRSTDINGQSYQKVLCLVRLHHYPLGIVELARENGELDARQLAEQIWRGAREQINSHLQEDGLETIERLDQYGINTDNAIPRCDKEREAVYENAPFISVIVATRNRPESLQRCVDALLEMDYPHYEIIVVDNTESSTETERVIQSVYRDNPIVRYIREKQPGLSNARNRGFQIAKGEIIAITDDDVRVDRYWLLELARGFQISKQVVCVTGLVLPMERETVEQHWFGQYGGYGKGFKRRTFNIKDRHGLFPYTAGKLGTGANLAVRADFFKLVGGFDSVLGTGTAARGGEDLAFFFEVMYRGYTLVYEPGALLYHPDRRDYEGLCKQMYSYGAGLTAYLTRTLFHHPLLLFDVMTKLPYGIYFVFSRRSPKNSKKSADYPKELTQLELKGMCYGPFGYIQSLWAGRNHKRSSGHNPPGSNNKRKDSCALMKTQTGLDGEVTGCVSASDFVLERVIEVELADTLPTIAVFGEETKRYYGLALCLVRLHTFPLGLVELRFEGKDLTPQRYLPIIWERLGPQIREHLRQDGLALTSELSERGFVHETVPHCLQERQHFLTHAPFVSIIVATRDRPQQIDSCLQRLLALNYPNYEIIVVDNAPSSTATAQLIRQRYQQYPCIRYVYEEQPGLSNARNAGLKRAKGEIVAMVDDDVSVDAHWLTEIARAFQSSEDIMCVTGLVVPLELETPAQKWFEEYGGFCRGFTRRIYDMRKYRPNSFLYPYSAGIFGAGANMAFRRTFLQKIKGFDPALGAGTPAGGGEDLAAFFQVIAHGHQLVYTPAAIVYHQHRRDLESLLRQMYFYGTGLVAFLTSCMVMQPRRIFDILLKMPYGLFFILSQKSPKNQKKSATFPKELAQAELRGMRDGLKTYISSKRAVQRKQKTMHIK